MHKSQLLRTESINRCDPAYLFIYSRSNNTEKRCLDLKGQIFLFWCTSELPYTLQMHFWNGKLFMEKGFEGVYWLVIIWQCANTILTFLSLAYLAHDGQEIKERVFLFPWHQQGNQGQSLLILSIRVKSQLALVMEIRSETETIIDRRFQDHS